LPNLFTHHLISLFFFRGTCRGAHSRCL
jgi:hypothetical protein